MLISATVLFKTVITEILAGFQSHRTIDVMPVSENYKNYKNMKPKLLFLFLNLSVIIIVTN